MRDSVFVKMIMRKKIICVAMAAVMILSLVACGNGKDNNGNSDKQDTVTTEMTTEELTTEEEETVVITVLTDKAHLVSTKFAEYKSTFEKDNEGVEIQFEAVEDYEEEMAKRLQSGDYGDVVLIPDSISNDQLEKYFEPLGTLEELSEKYEEKYIQGRAVDGMVYGLPRYASVYGVAYNEVVFANAGVVELPVTPDEFIAVLEKIESTQPGIAPYYTGYKNGEWLWQWQMNVWGSVAADMNYRNSGMVGEQEPFAEGTPNYVVHKLLYDIVEKGLCETYIEDKYKKPFHRFLNRGSFGCMMLSSDHLYELQTADVNPDDISFMPFPYNVDGKQYAGIEMDYSYAINKNSPNKEAAKAWIQYMLNKSGYAKSEGAISIKKNADLPDVLMNFQDVEFVVMEDATASSTDKYEELNTLSGIELDNDTEKNRLIKSAIGESEETFEDIMTDWNLRWKAALQGIRYASVVDSEEGESSGSQPNGESDITITPEYQEFLDAIRSNELQ